VRQRPGRGSAIFLTLEDETGIANTIVWQRDFARLMPVIMGSKFVRVTGKLQSASDVVHIVAERMEDLTPWLGTLLDEANPYPDMGGGKDMGDGKRRRPAVPPDPGAETLARQVRNVMPKGRNFH